MKSRTFFFAFSILFSCSANNREPNEDVDTFKSNKNIIWTSKTDTIIIGKALDAKAGAIVITYDNENPYYIDGLDFWDEKTYNLNNENKNSIKKS